jgi:hypothetical protein
VTDRRDHDSFTVSAAGRERGKFAGFVFGAGYVWVPLMDKARSLAEVQMATHGSAITVGTHVVTAVRANNADNVFQQRVRRREIANCSLYSGARFLGAPVRANSA